MSKRLIILIAVVIIAASAGCVFLMNNDDSPSSNVVYHVDGISVDRQTCGDSAILKDIDPAYSVDGTFFGWNTSSEWNGITYVPGEKISVKGDIDLHAILVNGLISTDAKGNIIFNIGNGDVSDGTLLDLRFFDVVNTITINDVSMDAIKNSKMPVSVMYPDGMCLTMDSNVMSGCPNGNLSIRICDVDCGKDVELFSGSSNIDKITGLMGFDIPVNSDVSEDTLFFPSTDVGGNELKTKSDGTRISFSVGSLGFRYVSLVTVDVIDTDGSHVKSDSDNYPEIKSSISKYYGRWHMFEKGDKFTISPSRSGTSYDMSGAMKKADGTYEVTTDSKLTISIVVGGEKHKIILPSDHMGYTMTVDSAEVEDGGRFMITYKLMSGYVDEDLTIKINGNAVELDGMSRIFVNDVRSDVVVVVTGVYDVRTYGIELPSDQEGYELTSSLKMVHHGQSYTMYMIILPDYEKGPDFELSINGKAVNASSGTIVVDDVKALQRIEVKGIQLESFNVVAGAHTTLKVDGAKVTKVTCRDIVTVSFDDGYSQPSKYVSNLPVTVHEVSGGYRITGDSVFPSVVKITVGDNINISGSKSAFLCTTDAVSVTAASGYELPENYPSVLSGLGAKNEKGLYKFGSDANLPSVYRVDFVCVDKKIDVAYYTAGSTIKESEVIPYRTGYSFVKWLMSTDVIDKDVVISSEWDTISYTLSIGKNLGYSINGSYYIHGPVKCTVTIEDNILISTEVGYTIPQGYLLQLIEDGNHYHLKSDVVIPSLYMVTYYNNGETKTFTYVEGSIVNIWLPNDEHSPIASLFAGYDTDKFMYWQYNNTKIEGRITIEQDYLLIAMCGS